MPRSDDGINFRFSGLHYASIFGIVELVAALIQMECHDINEEDSLGILLLHGQLNMGMMKL